MRIDRIQKAYNVEIKFVHFPLHPDTPEEGRALEELFRCDKSEVLKKNANMLSLMEAEGLPYGVRTHTYNSRLAQELAAWAVTQEGGDAIHKALFEVYFVATKNVADHAVLLDVVDSIGLDRAEAEQVLDQRSFKAQVDTDWEKSRSYGVTGVPTYVAGKAGVVGAQPYEAIEKLITDAGATAR